MSEYPATTLALNKSKYYVLLTIPVELRQHFNGRKQLKRSTGTSDLRDAKRRQHNIATELYGQLDACKPDVRDMISDLLGWIGDADEVQRMEDEGHLEGLIQGQKNLEYSQDPEDDAAVDYTNEQAAKALELYRAWKSKEDKGRVHAGISLFSAASQEYLQTKPYGPAKTLRDAELALSQFEELMGDVDLSRNCSAPLTWYFATKERNHGATLAAKVNRTLAMPVPPGHLPGTNFGFRLTIGA